MSGKQIIGIAVACFVVFIAMVVALFSPLAKGLFAPGNDTRDDVIGLLLTILVLSVIGILSVTFVIACCQLAKRLGYDQSAGLLLLIPLVNLVVFFRWAFIESPNEKRISRLKRTQKPTSSQPFSDGAN